MESGDLQTGSVVATEVELKEPIHHRCRGHTEAAGRASRNAATGCGAVNEVAAKGLQMGSARATLAGSQGLQKESSKATLAGLGAPFHRHHTIADGTAAQGGTAGQHVAVACRVAGVQGSGPAFAEGTVEESEGQQQPCQLRPHRRQAHGTVVQNVAVACEVAGAEGSVTAFARGTVAESEEQIHLD